ncbi:hypothetical protein BDV09DRAFT_22716 [Aspergillus tetrazonus]
MKRLHDKCVTSVSQEFHLIAYAAFILCCDGHFIYRRAACMARRNALTSVKRCAELRNRRPAGSSNWMLVSRSRICVWM